MGRNLTANARECTPMFDLDLPDDMQRLLKKQ